MLRKQQKLKKQKVDNNKDELLIKQRQVLLVL